MKHHDTQRKRRYIPAGLWISLLLLLTVTVSVLTVGCDGGTDAGADTVTAAQTDGGTPGAESLPETLPPETTPADGTQSASETETEPATEPDTEADFASLVDFVVDVEPGRDIRVLQLTDTQIIDASQCRTDDRLNYVFKREWAPEHMDDLFRQYVTDVIEEAKPDFIFLTGDLVYGEFDDSGEVFTAFVEFMDSFGIPWAPVFGNHDNESKMGVDWQCEQFTGAKHCLFVQRKLTGNGNYTVGLTQGGKLLRVFFMMDSNGCGNVSAESLANKHTTSTIGFSSNQIRWATDTASAVRAAVPDVRFSFAFHIQPDVFEEAFSEYGFVNGQTQSEPINIDTVENRAETDFGYVGRDLKSPWSGGPAWKKLIATGADSFFVGHEHCNSGSVVVDGIRYQFGMKSSAYDRINYRMSDGSIVGGTLLAGTPLVGGTLLTLDGSGDIKDGRIVYASGGVDGGETEIETDASEEVCAYRLDFNGTDFDMKVTTDGVKNETAAVPAGTAPEGADGCAATARETYLVAVGVSLPADVPFDTLTAFRVRMRATESSAHSKDPLFRLYNDRDNSILSSHSYVSVGGRFGEWCVIDILPYIKEAGLVRDGILQPFTIVYRCYDADTLVEFDWIEPEVTSPVAGMPCAPAAYAPAA